MLVSIFVISIISKINEFLEMIINLLRIAGFSTVVYTGYRLIKIIASIAFRFPNILV